MDSRHISIFNVIKYYISIREYDMAQDFATTNLSHVSYRNVLNRLLSGDFNSSKCLIDDLFFANANDNEAKITMRDINHEIYNRLSHERLQSNKRLGIQTEDSRIDKNIFYNDNLDMDQQSPEFWDNL